MKATLRKLLTGLAIPQEYICVGGQDVSDPLQVYLTDSSGWKDVTATHLFLGYRPLIIALIFPQEESHLPADGVCLSFNAGAFNTNSEWRGFAADKKSIARLLLGKINEKITGNSKVVFYSGELGIHHFISQWHQQVNNFYETIKKKPKGNIGLPGNLYEQIRIAYSVARKISIITVSDGSLVNLFPTDLHGATDSSFYISSLRIGGKACEQVQRFKKIVLSEIDANQYRSAYALGKNHTKELTDRGQFNLHPIPSSIFRFPLPIGAIAYRELEYFDHLDVGIHRVFIYKVINKETLQHGVALAHIHRYYAQWRLNNGLETTYFLR